MPSPTPWTPLTVADARALGWKPQPYGCGTVTRACDEWLVVSQDQRAYLDPTLAWIKGKFDAEWTDIMESPGYDEAPDPYDMLMGRVGMSPGDWEWMTLAGLLRDMVTAYEVYVVKGYQEVMYRHGHDIKPTARPPKFGIAWDECKKLGLDVRPPAVNDIFSLRNILTHQRGELRNEAERLKYGEDSLWGSVAHLTGAKVLAWLDVLQGSVDDLDPVLWAYSWGRQVAPPMVAPTV